MQEYGMYLCMSSFAHAKDVLPLSQLLSAVNLTVHDGVASSCCPPVKIYLYSQDETRHPGTGRASISTTHSVMLAMSSTRSVDSEGHLGAFESRVGVRPCMSERVQAPDPDSGTGPHLQLALG